MSQYLGDISAYALAVSQGYTGTEEEYAELMASYATVGQTAVTAAQTATTKASEAATSATTATNKATEATTAATTATTKAGEASTSASTATSAKDTAVSAARTATTKATEATTAAATATSAATTATTAKDDAVSAKTAAQTAQTGAETAAASVQSSAEQIATNAADISQLKSEFTALTEPLPTYNVRYIEPTYLSGYMNENGVVSQSTSYKYTSEKIPVSPGDVVFIYKENMAYATFLKSLEGTGTSYAMRYVTAYSGDDVVVASGSNATHRYVVPEGIDGIVVTVYTSHSSEEYEQKIRIQSALTEDFPNTFNILDGKKWCACGDSFTEAGYGTGEADLSYYTFTTGRFAGQRKTYPWIIGLRNNMDIVNIAKSGMSMANSSGSNAFVLDDYYKNIPSDSDYITLKFGINDVNHGSQLGTIDSTDPATFYGAWNIAMDYITTNFPYAKVGIIVSNGMSSNFTFVDATIAIAKKWGIPYLDEVYDTKVPLLHRVNRPDVSAEVLQRKLEAFRISASNTHPNVNAQYYEASFVEDWLRTL